MKIFAILLGLLTLSATNIVGAVSVGGDATLDAPGFDEAKNVVFSPRGPSADVESTARGQVLFGASVELSSTSSSSIRLLVGAPLYDFDGSSMTAQSNTNGGAVFLYEFNEASTWDIIWEFIGDASEEVGRSVSMSEGGSRVAILRNNQSPRPVEVYDVSSGGMVGSPIFCQPPNKATTTFATANLVTLSANGQRLAISCQNGRGRVELFDLVGDVWTLIGFLSGAVGSQFGSATAFSKDGNTLLVTSRNYDGLGMQDTGAFSVFQSSSSGSTWTQLGSDVPGSAANIHLGSAGDISSDGSIVVVTAPEDSNGANLRGSAIVYTYNPTTDAWTQRGEPVVGEEGDMLGQSVALSDDGTRFVVSSWLHDGSRGQARLLEFDGTNYVEVAQANGLSRGDRLGFGFGGVPGFGRGSVAISEDGALVAVGESWTNNDSGVSTGRAYVLDSFLHTQTTKTPTKAPSDMPSGVPSSIPTAIPTATPTALPTSPPSTNPTSSPSDAPTSSPSSSPTASPSEVPTSSPSGVPTSTPSSSPTYTPTTSPTAAPSRSPSAAAVATGSPTGTNPTGTPSLRPSVSPSEGPTGNPSQLPSMAPTGLPTTRSPTGSPTGSPSSTPSFAPSGTPSKSPSIAPTAATSAPSTSSAPSSQSEPTASPSSSSINKFQYDLTLDEDDIKVRFSESTSEEEIILQYHINRRPFVVRVFEPDCETLVDESYVRVRTASSPDPQEPTTHDILEVSLDIQEGNITSSSVYEIVDDDHASLGVCARVDLESPTGTRVVFHEQILFVMLSLANNFTVASIDLERIDPSVHVEDVELNYGLTACQCSHDDGDDHVCQDQVLRQGDIATICVSLPQNASVDIASVRSFSLTQNGTVYSKISDGEYEDDLTQVQIAPNGHQKLAVIQFMLTSAFFDDANREDPANVTAQGSVVLSFDDDDESGGTRRRRHLRHVPIRLLAKQQEEEKETESVAGFDNVALQLAKNNDDGSKSSSSPVLAKVSWIVGLVMVGLVYDFII